MTVTASPLARRLATAAPSAAVLTGICTTVRVSGFDRVSLRKSNSLATWAGSILMVGAISLAENLARVITRISGCMTWAAWAFMKAVSWASVGSAGVGTAERPIWK